MNSSKDLQGSGYYAEGHWTAGYSQQCTLGPKLGVEKSLRCSFLATL